MALSSELMEKFASLPEGLEQIPYTKGKYSLSGLVGNSLYVIFYRDISERGKISGVEEGSLKMSDQSYINPEAFPFCWIKRS